MSNSSTVTRLVFGSLMLSGVLRSITGSRFQWMFARIGARLAVAALTPVGAR
jgi:hypothetical protein